MEITNVCVFGQGFIGLPLALSFAMKGCNTIGVDIDDLLVSNLNKGITHNIEKFNEMNISEILKVQITDGRYKATVNANNALKKCNNIIVTVGIPIKDGKYIMNYLEDCCKVIGKNLKKDDLILIRSTVIPGTTEEFIIPILEDKSSMKAGEDFYIAYASERVAEGSAFKEFESMNTLVGAINEESLIRASDLLSIVCKAEIIRASCIKAVETSKVFENVQRDVNIALSQEFARFTEKLGIDIFEVIKLANTHKRVNILTPGSGVGGYCIPNAYHYIAPKASELDVNMDILKLCRKKNKSVPDFIAGKVEELLNLAGKRIKKSKIAVLGLAMKDYSSDDRMSPSVDICNILIKKGADVLAFDPLVNTDYYFKAKTQEEALKNADAVLILTKQINMKIVDHNYMAKLMNEKPVCVDLKAVINKEEAEKYGFIYWRI